MPIKTSSAKSKGRALCSHVAGRLRAVFGLAEADVFVPASSSSGQDLHLSPAARKVLPFAWEMKNTRACSPQAWLRQSQANAKEGELPLVVWKPGGVSMESSLVIINLEDFLTLVKGK